jgi:myo-inositol-1(or 4)-monophosphatase
MEAFNIEEPIAWVREGGALALGSFRNVVGWRKPDRTWVTEADQAIERMLVARIVERFPDHGIVGEEQARRTLDHEFVWAIDPLDGTAVFLSGLPTWGVSLGLLWHGRPYAGILYFPLLGDCYWAGPGGGAWLNGEPIHVAAPRPFESDDWLSTPSNAHRRFEIDFIGKTRSIGATIGAFAYTARGSAIGGLISRFAIWDIAAGMAILSAAGGTAITLAGATLDTAPLLDGRPFDEPVLLGAPAHVAALQAAVRTRAR